MMDKIVLCPLCGDKMFVDGDHLRCCTNNLHACLVSEWEKYENDEIDLDYIVHRMKIRRGKMVRGK